MDFDLEPRHIELRERTKQFCDGKLAPGAKGRDGAEEFSWDAVHLLKEFGLFGIPFPKTYGGMGEDAMGLCLILEELGRVDASIALTIESHNGLCSNQIYLHGNEDQRRRYIPRLASGQDLGAWALTEPGAGSDAASIQTRAEFDGKNWILNGSKTFTTQGSVAGIYVIFAKTSAEFTESGREGLTAFVVEKGTPGLSVGKIEKKMGLRSSDTAQLHLHNLQLSPEAIIGKAGRAFRDAMIVLDGGRVAISGISVGIARAALEEGIQWVRNHKEECGISAENPGLTSAQRTLAQLASEIDAARLLTWRAAYLMDQKRPYSQEASMAKLISGDLVVRATSEILDLVGPEGASMDYPVQRFFRDSKLYQIGEGSSQIQQLVIARHLLKEAEKAHAFNIPTSAAARA
jgi:hypothetical protein